jgi:hypothetical protein
LAQIVLAHRIVVDRARSRKVEHVVDLFYLLRATCSKTTLARWTRLNKRVQPAKTVPLRAMRDAEPAAGVSSFLPVGAWT